MNKVDRRHFLMTSMALPAALKASALRSQNDTVRVAVVGFNGRGKAHINAYLKIPNVEIAALCDIDQAVLDNGCKMIEAAGKSGTVERMTLRVAVLRDVRGVLHVIPNGQITTVSNLTRSWSRAVIEVGVGYGTDVDRAIAVFRDELSQFRADPGWTSRFTGDSDVLGVEDLGEHSVVIRTLLRTVPGAQWDVAREFRRRIKNRLDAEEIEMPYPQRTVHVRHHGVEGDVPAGGL